MESREIFYLVRLVYFICIFAFTNNVLAVDSVTYQVQQKLHEFGYEPGPIDGLWGKKTEKALKDYQKKQGLKITGKPDESTCMSLGITVAPRQKETKTDSKTPGHENKYQNEHIASVNGTVKNIGIVMGLGMFFFIDGESTKFILDDEQATKHGLMNGRGSFNPRLNDQRVKVFYDKNKKEKYGHQYYQVIELKEVE